MSETKITEITESQKDPSIGRREILKGALKSIILSPDKCLCYAGDFFSATYAIDTIFSQDLISKKIGHLLDYLVTVNTETNCETDFMLCELSTDSKMYKVSNKGYAEVEAGWIGDVVAFEAYQEMYHDKINPDTKEQPMQRMMDSMLALVNSDRFKNLPTIGDHVIVTKTTANGFKYLGYSISHSVPIPNGESSVKNDIEHGGYAESIIVPEVAGIGAVAVHMFPVNIGVLYYPKENTHNPVIFKGVSTPEFVAELKKTTGILFRGIDNNYITMSKKIL